MARRLLWPLVIVVLLTTTGLAKGKKVLPKLVTNAKYVYITTYEGADLTSPRLTQGDLQAVNDLREALRKWGYYTETIHRQDADLIFRVRKGGTTAKMGGNIGGSSAPDRGAGPAFVGGDAQGYIGPPQDMLEVYDAKIGTDAAPLWRGMEMNGLDAPGVNLLQDFRKQVEEAAKQP